jgi:hypothetical protein
MNTAWRCTCLIFGMCSLTGESTLSSDQSSIKRSPEALSVVRFHDELTLKPPPSFTYTV